MTVLKSLGARLRRAKLALITDARDGPAELGQFVARMTAAGADLIVLHDPKLSSAESIRALGITSKVCDGQALVATTDWAAAVAGAADLVHLDVGRSPVDRAELPPFRLVGCTRGASSELLTASAAGFDYLFLEATPAGPPPQVSEAGTRGTGSVEPVSTTARALPPFALDTPPWFVTLTPGASVEAILSAGARRIVVDESAERVDDPAELLRHLSSAVSSAWRSDSAAQSYRLAAYTR